ncbi:MAG: hypothetical protein BWK77_05105, partial [Verrucomicrobia bacterium A1]
MRTPSFILLPILCAAGLTAWALQPEPADTSVQPAALADQSPTADQLNLANQAGQAGVTVQWNRRLGTPLSIRGRNLGERRGYSRGTGLLARGLGNAAEDSVAILDNLSGLFRARDARQEFAAERVDTDALGFRHVRTAQFHRGLRVIGGELIVHFDRANQAYEVNGRYVPDVSLDVTPQLKPAEAVRTARQDLAAGGQPGGELIAGPELVVFALGAEPRLAYELALWHFDGKAGQFRWRCWVDALDGKILLRFNDVQKIAAPTANGSAATISGSILSGEGGGATNVTGWYENTGFYYLYDKSRFWYVYNVSSSSSYPDPNTYAYRSTAAWGTSDRTEMSAARNFDAIQAYFRTVHGRNSFDHGNAYARANIHEGTSYVNAYWDGDDFHFGDGDGVEANSLAVLDVCAHEYTHAVDEYTANLYYYGESGALNESFSDIFGACVEFYAQPDGRALYPNKSAGRSDWLMGEDAWLSSKALRDMRNPSNPTTVGSGNEQPSRYKGTYWYFGTGDSGGVHYNSGVQNFFFYLLCEGGSGTNDGLIYSVTGIGRTNAEKVAFRALAVYCGQYSDHAAVREAWISAAQDLNAAWVASAETAWSACGVGPTLPTVSTPFFNPPAGSYASAVAVTVTCATASARIYFTLDGNEPTDSSTRYTSAIPISADATLKAKAYKDGMQPSATASARYMFLGTRFYSFPMDASPGWTTSGSWAFGHPTGGGGEHGHPDPANGFTGANVYGNNLGGDYANSIANTQWLVTSPLNLGAASNVKLVFQRWLGVERPAYDHAYIDVSNNGSTWTRVWENSAEIADSAWSLQVLDISSVADRQTTVYVRWGIGPTDESWVYCGWNLDDVELWGQPASGDFPAAPTNLVASAIASNRVQLTWNDASGNEQGFAVERRIGSGTWSELARVGANVTTCTDTSATPTTTYSYRVRAFNAVGYSGYSNESTVTTPGGAGDGWDPGDDTGSGATVLPAPTSAEQSHGVHTLSTSDRYDWLRVNLSAGVTYNFNSVGGSGDLYAELYSDSAGTTRVAYDDDSGGSLQFSLTYSPVVSGAFYLRVRTYSIGSAAAYTLKYRATGGTIPQAPYGGVAWALPGTVEAENFDTGGEGVAYHDVSVANDGGQYRTSEGVDIAAGASAGNGFLVGWARGGEWIEYTVNVASSQVCGLTVRAACQGGGGLFSVSVDGADVTGALTVPNTGGWFNWVNVNASGINLTAGEHVIRLSMLASGTSGFVGNFDRLQFTAAPGPKAIPGFIQAEDFDTGGEGVGYHDTTAANEGGQYRTGEGVDIAASAGASNGYLVGWAKAGEWIEYTVNVASSQVCGLT